MTTTGPLVVWTDAGFLAAVDMAFTDSARRSGANLVCRLGCTQCCTGTFAISMLDAKRLRDGYRALAQADPHRFEHLHDRVRASQNRLGEHFPGDAVSGVLNEDEDSQQRFEEFGNKEICPVLDPATGACDLYATRPMTCRVFGPPLRTDDGLGVCELCFQHATEEEVEAAEMILPPAEIEAALTESMGHARTVVAFALPVSTALIAELS